MRSPHVIMTPMRRRATSPLFVGRGNEAGVLQAALRAAGEGQPALVFVAGDAGVGKTRLVRHLEDHVREQGALVLRGECLALSGEFPYAPIVGALRDAGQGALAGGLARLTPASQGEIARLVPEISAQLEGDAGSLNQGRLFELLLALLRHLGEETTVLFVIEDGHWADVSTRDFLSFLASSLSTERVLTVVTYRPDDLSRDHPLRVLLSELIRCETVLSLALEPLGAAEIEQLIEQITGTHAPVALVEEIFARSQGNPFFAEELLAAQSGDDPERLPASLRDALLVRCHGLAPDAVMLLGTLAVLGRPARQAALGELAGLPEPRLSSALRSAMAAHIVAHRPQDDRFEIRHALVREAVYGDLLPGERSALHRSIAETLAATGAGTHAELAYHWDVAGEPVAALEASISAGLGAERVYASVEARQHFERAVRLWDAHEPPGDSVRLDRIELLRHAAEAARLTGDWDCAVERCREAVALVDEVREPLRAALLHERVGEYLLWDDEAALACYSTALALLPDNCGRERARIMGAKALALHFLQRWEEARECGQAALDEARQAQARTEEGYAANVLGIALAFLGEHARGEAHVRDAMRIAEDGGTAEEVGRAYAHLAEVLRIRGDVAGALSVMVEGQDVAARMGMANWFGSAMNVSAAEDLLRLGRWGEAAERLSETARLDLSQLAELLQSSVEGRLAVGRGEFAEAQTRLEDARARCDDQTPVGYVVGPYAGLAELALWDGRTEDARQSLADAFGLVSGRAEPLYVPVLLWLGVRADVDAALAARPREGCREHHADVAAQWCAELEDLVARYSATDAPAEADAYLTLSRAELTRLEHQEPAAWRAAAAAWERLEHPLLAAYAGWREVEAVLSGGHPRGDAATRLQAVHVTATQLGARPLSREIEALARAARIDLSAGSAARAPAAPSGESSPAAQFGLTAREMDVLPLIAEGCTNREIARQLFISEKTASVHVSHILSKLDAENRVRAAAIARRLGLLDTMVVAD